MGGRVGRWQGGRTVGWVVSGVRAFCAVVPRFTVMQRTHARTHARAHAITQSRTHACMHTHMHAYMAKRSVLLAYSLPMFWALFLCASWSMTHGSQRMVQSRWPPAQRPWMAPWPQVREKLCNFIPPLRPLAAVAFGAATVTQAFAYMHTCIPVCTVLCWVRARACVRSVPSCPVPSMRVRAYVCACVSERASERVSE